MQGDKFIYNLVFIFLSVCLGLFFFDSDVLSQTTETYEADSNTYANIEISPHRNSTTTHETIIETATTSVSIATSTTEEKIVVIEEPSAISTATTDTTTMSDEEKSSLIAQILQEAEESKKNRGVGFIPSEAGDVRTVPFYSQFTDIAESFWKKESCGVVSLAMIIDFYQADIAPDTLREQGIALGAYDTVYGWSHAGLVSLAKQHGMDGATTDLSHLNTSDAFNALKKSVEKGPVIVSVHYAFDPSSTIPHLAVITDIRDDLVYYNDPAALAGGGSLSMTDFNKAWKKRYIEIYPAS